MPSMVYSATFWAPDAHQVTIEVDGVVFSINTENGLEWRSTIEMELGRHLYRFCIDGLWYSPDPYNSEYTVQDGAYYSILTESGPVDHFAEEPVLLYMSDIIPNETALGTPRSQFGPSSKNVTSVLEVKGLVRAENHAVWVWQSLSGRRWVFDSVVGPATTALYCTVQYEAFRDFGPWAACCYLNGRYCGQTAFTVTSLGYPPGRAFSLRPQS